MTATAIVLLILEIEGIALAIALVTIFAYAAWSQSVDRARAVRLSAARAIVATHLESHRIPRDGMWTLRTLSSDDLRRLFHEVAPTVGRAERAWLRELAASLGELDSVIADTRDDQWWVRLSGIRALTLLDADPSLVHPLLRDPRPEIRGRVAQYIAQRPTEEGIAALIAMLSDDATFCRMSAKDALMQLGGPAVPQLVARLENPGDAEVLALLDVACAIATHDFLAVALKRATDPRPAVRLRVTRLLRGIGGADAVDQIGRMTTDSDPLVRAAAAEALGYLNQWTAVSIIARLLDDSISRVRLAAAVSLDQLGPAGELLLRRARAKGSAPAAAAASRILDDPSRA